MSGPTISLGLGARGLKDKDFMSVSDPYVTVSRPDARGGFTVLRTSETKKVIIGSLALSCISISMFLNIRTR